MILYKPDDELKHIFLLSVIKSISSYLHTLKQKGGIDLIRYIKGDIFKSPAQVLVNTVNTVGVMGKGIALEFKKRYPDMFDAYRDVCDRHQLKVGSLMLYYEPDHWVLLFPTKEHWRRPSQIDYIEKGLQKLALHQFVWVAKTL